MKLQLLTVLGWTGIGLVVAVIKVYKRVRTYKSITIGDVMEILFGMTLGPIYGLIMLVDWLASNKDEIIWRIK